MSLRSVTYPAPGVPEIRLVLLPGAGITAVDFEAQGVVAAVRARGLPVEIVATEPDIELYLDGRIAAALHAEIVTPGLRLWLMGISMGGMGALLYASAYPAQLDGIVLLAPFLGTRGTTAELTRAGGLAGWSAAGSAATPPEQTMLRWLQARRETARPALYLGYAAQDRFAPAHRILAETLPADRVAVCEGGHDWASWMTLWAALLDRAPFGPAGRCAGP
jgi:pimeloyl-ACP methyl ester carboxylesterase